MKRILLLIITTAILFFIWNCKKGNDVNLHIFRFSNGTEPQTLDPAIMTGHPEFTIAVQLFEGLTVYDAKTLTSKPGVAARWEISDNGKEYIFFLRKDAKWSDGTAITAHSFRYSWLRALAPVTASQYAYQLWYIKNGEQYSYGKCKPEEVGISVIDDYILKVELVDPTPYFLDLTSFPTFMPVPEHIIAKYGEDKWYLKKNIVCNGPFQIFEWLPSQYMLLEKNLLYWDKDKVYLDKIQIYPIEDSNTALEMYLNNELDMVNAIPSVRMDEMKKHPDIHIAPFLATYYYKINTLSSPHLKNKKVRAALSLSLNRKHIVDYIGKSGQIPAFSFVPPNMPDYSPSFSDKEDPEQARKLLEEAGYKNGEKFPPITILYNTSEDHKKIAEAIQQIWTKELNIKVELENQEWKVFLDTVDTMKYQISRAGWIGDYVDPNTFLDLWITDGGNNRTGWSNQDYDLLIGKAKIEKDYKKRMDLFSNAEKILMDEIPIIPIYYYVRVYMIKPNVSGFFDNIRDIHPLKEVSIITKMN